jgi:hypothetical protein
MKARNILKEMKPMEDELDTMDIDIKVVAVKPSNAPGWHVVKLDDDAYGILKREREELRKTHHASYSDAVREIKRREKRRRC